MLLCQHGNFFLHWFFFLGMKMLVSLFMLQRSCLELSSWTLFASSIIGLCTNDDSPATSSQLTIRPRLAWTFGESSARLPFTGLRFPAKTCRKLSSLRELLTLRPNWRYQISLKRKFDRFTISIIITSSAYFSQVFVCISV